MENHQQNIDDLFRDELDGYTEVPPPAAWDALEKKLATRPGRGTGPGPRVWYAALLGLVMLLSIPAVRNMPGILNPGGQQVAEADGNATSAAHTTPPANEHQAANGTDGNAAAENNNDATANMAPAESAGMESIKDNNDDNKPTNETVKANNTSTAIGHSDKNWGTKESEKTAGKRTKTKKSQVAANNINAGSNTNNVKNNNEIAYQDTKDNTSNQTPQQNNIYNSHSSNPAPAEAETSEAAANDTRGEQKNGPAENKKPIASTQQKDAPKQKAKIRFARFELGIKGGVELGFDNDAARKLVVSPYIQYNLSRKFAIMLQPAIKTAAMDTRRIGNASAYYQVTGGSVTQTTDSAIVHVVFTNDSLWKWSNVYTQTHDSIVKTYSIGNTYAEFETPVLLKYNVSKKFSVYAGVNIAYSKLIGINERTTTTNDIALSRTIYAFTRAGAPAPPTAALDNVFTYKGTPYSQYTGPIYTANTDGSFRAGYMLGFSYEFTKRWLFDGLVQQTNAKQNVRAGYNVNTTLSAPYVRFTLGYKLLKK